MIAALGIAWSILPRPDKFVPPRDQLHAADQPRLFHEIEAIAAAIHQPMLKEVYLLMEPNAFVASRGGVMGFGSKRVMGLGLPLLQTMTVSEMNAVIAHEFGHC